jgi:hypothetical protein
MGSVAGEPNQRSAERVKVEAFVKVSGGDSEFVFRTRDLSKTGVFLYTRVAHIYPFKVGSTLTLELYDYDEFVTAKVVVVRIVEPNSAEADKYPTGFGVRIIDMDDANREKLVQMLAQASAGALY